MKATADKLGLAAPQSVAGAEPQKPPGAAVNIPGLPDSGLDRSQSKAQALADDRSRPLSAAEPAAEVAAVLDYFDRVYPQPRCGLDFQDPYQLLVATILSAQCTDSRVNQVTPALFKAFPDPASMALAPIGAIEELVKTCGLYRAKAKNLRACAGRLIDHYGGQVPDRLEELVTLPGVGRKTANVVLGDAFGIPGLTVDTHLGRVSRRLGLSAKADAVGVEKDLMGLIPRPLWTRFSHQAISHGRSLCRARKPVCGECGLIRCPSRAA